MSPSLPLSLLQHPQQFLRHYLIAVQFFTRIPVTGRLAQWVGFSPAMLRASAAHFPGVGWVVGGSVALLTWGLLTGLPPVSHAVWVAAALGTVLSVLMTGAFHEDGLADVADGLGGTLDRHRALEIMKDSRVGAFGAIAVALVLLTKLSLLASLGQLGTAALCGAVFAGHIVSRTWPLLTIRLLVHVGDVAGSKSKPLADQISGVSLLVGGLWCLAGLALTLAGLATEATPSPGEQIGAAMAPVALWLLAGIAMNGMAWVGMTRWFHRRLQGFTGDCLGAIQQIGEIAFYLGLVLAWPLITQGPRP